MLVNCQQVVNCFGKCWHGFKDLQPLAKSLGPSSNHRMSILREVCHVEHVGCNLQGGVLISRWTAVCCLLNTTGTLCYQVSSLLPHVPMLWVCKGGILLIL